MQLKKVQSVVNIPALGNFRWTGGHLKKYNVIYGWNGSGKTTLSRLLSFLERRQIHIPEMNAAEFSIATDTDAIRQVDLAAHSCHIRVFNEDFIRDNLAFNDSKAARIIMLGKEHIDAQKDITTLERSRDEVDSRLASARKVRSKLMKSTSVLTNAGSDVGNFFANTPLAMDQYYGRTYTKRSVDKLLASGDITEATLDTLIIADQAEIDTKRDTIKVEKAAIEFTAQTITDLAPIFESASVLLKERVQVSLIQELEEKPSVRDWVETGFHIHQDAKLTTCQFCTNSLPMGRLERLGTHFTDELTNLKNNINSLVGQITGDKFLPEVPVLDSSALFPDLAKSFVAARKVIERERANVESAIEALLEALNSKYNAPLGDTSPASVSYPKVEVEAYNAALLQANEQVSQHNTRVAERDQEVKRAARTLELHLVALALRAGKYFQAKRAEDEADAQIEDLTATLRTTTDALSTKKAALLNATEALEQINAILNTYFGNRYIYLEPAEAANPELGYRLMRRGEEAKFLSEGEKSVLALSHFLVKLAEEGFDKGGGVVVIDDPVDSQDEVFLYQTFGLIQTHLRKCGQLVLLTHNFNFFSLVRDWLCDGQMNNDAQLYLMTNCRDGAAAGTEVSELPALLRDFKSEYQYLVYRLHHFDRDHTTLETPFVGNIARRILEYFAAFKWSCRRTEQFTNIAVNRFVDQHPARQAVANFVVKFVNEYSHGQNFANPVSASAFEAPAIAKNVLAFIRDIDPEHFGALTSLIAGVPPPSALTNS